MSAPTLAVLPTTQRSEERAEFLADIITTALEGGVGYWSQASLYRWWSPDLDGGTAEHRDGEPNAYAVLHELDDDESGYKEQGVLVTVETVASALVKIAAAQDVPEQTPAGLSSALGIHKSYRDQITAASKENDAGEIDAELADMIVQVAVLGEVVYG